MKTILIIEDDENLSRGIAFAFEKDGYQTHSVGTAGQARSILKQHNMDLIILDIGLPDGDGIALCKEIRAYSNVPIIMLTARDMETDVVSGLLSGADDYVTKPFSLSILRARVEALLRRTAPETHNVIKSGIYAIDTELCKFYRGDEEIPVSATEYKLLAYFMRNAQALLTKEQILSALWDIDGNYVDENTLPVNISRLRSKIETDPKKPEVIRTVHGIGYIWNGGK